MSNMWEKGHQQTCAKLTHDVTFKRAKIRLRTVWLESQNERKFKLSRQNHAYNDQELQV